jgi:hypothetical protein
MGVKLGSFEKNMRELDYICMFRVFEYVCSASSPAENKCEIELFSRSIDVKG